MLAHPKPDRRPPRTVALAVVAALLSFASPVRGQVAWPLPEAGLPPPPPAPPAPAPVPPPSFRPAFGAASIVFTDVGGRRARQDGVALQLRLANPVSERFDTNLSLTWGLTDWERAREWIDAGNRAGSWTTEKIESVARWSQEGGEAQSLHLLGAIFAEMFLVMTYAAVPVCYVGSAGGATSHLQVDVTGTLHLTSRDFVDVWAEGGIGMAALPVRFLDWSYALGPVAGIGFDAGPVRIGARAMWAPGELNSSERGNRSVVTSSLTFGARY